ncbi:premnaspirodiene oxygenase-like [Olea europaea var. sylvestris]|uniref:premnaspirodiene oxygenase-like n=1 Tax=Olea europaea var. sylvestris TaxID=158386 RepID=UPI000C1D3DFB|nr:premnaspirodiene oxygenase-like [Olea europaea var. sylvestris]
MRCKLDMILDTIIDEHGKNLVATNEANGELGCEDLVDVLLRLKESGELKFPITNDNIKAVILARHSHIMHSSFDMWYNYIDIVFSPYSDYWRTAFYKVWRDRVTSIMLIKQAASLAGNFDLADLLPPVKVFDIISWNKFKLLKMRCKLDMILDTFIDEHGKNLAATNEANGELGCEDLVDVLLRLKERHVSAGTEFSSSTLDRTMEELMKNHRYLKLVVKETLRLHPPVSIISRACREEFENGGYRIPLNANVVVNIWAIGRDPNYWKNPESFERERFEKNSVDFLANHFEHLPFGSGKRICPGMTFGLANIKFLLARLLYDFDWKLAS